jgi:hypothetical protein
MVYTESQPLLARALECLEKAKRSFIFRLLAHFATLAFAIIAAFALSAGGEHGDRNALEVVEITAAIFAIITECIALFFHHKALEQHSLGRQAMRRVMLLDALSPGDAQGVLEELKHHFSQDVHRKSDALAAKDKTLPEKERRLLNYYWSSKPTGQARLRDHLFESAIFSQRLYSAAWMFSLVSMVILLVGALFVVALLLGNSTNLVLRVIIAVIAFLPSCQELDHMLTYRLVSEQLKSLLHRVEKLYALPLQTGPSDPRLLADLGDYNAATTFAPPIRTTIYYLLNARLSAEFEQKMKKLGQAPPAPSRTP